MDLQSKLTALKTHGSDLTLVERVHAACGLAKQLEKLGEYEEAYEALAEFWPERDKTPRIEGLDDETKAEMLLRVGALAGWLGKTDQTSGGQETAKNLITLGIEMFERLGQSARVIEGHTDLALCYFREGSFDEARIHLAAAIRDAKAEHDDLKAIALIRAGEVEVAAGRLNEALRFYNEAGPLLDRSEDHALKGAFHNESARLFRRFGRADSIDRALIEYTAAAFHFEQAGNSRYLASVENNLGFLFFTIRKHQEAHQHLDRARYLFLELKDAGMAAQVDETRARTFLAEGRLAEAERLLRSVVRTLERGDEQAILAEALTTYGTVKARLGRYGRAKQLLDRAIEIAQTAGDLEGAGRAKLSTIEELAAQTSPIELATTFETGAELLEKSDDPVTSKRLIACARQVINALRTGDSESPGAAVQTCEESSLRQQVRNYEKALIERALRDGGGSVTRAARLLGFRHHQSLISLINSRHRDLLNTRSAVRQRRQHLFSKPGRLKRKLRSIKPEHSKSHISVLHVEDHELVADLVKDTLSAENWQVDLCVDGDSALRILTSNEHFDALVIDDSLPGLSGLELVQRARKMTHRRRTPIVILSGDALETEAWRVGVDAFLTKPEQIGELPATITRLLKEGSNRG